MAITVTEHVESREWGADGSVKFKYFVRGTASDTTARVQLLDSAPETYQGKVREDNPNVNPVWADTESSNGLWECEVVYQPAGALPITPLEVGESSYSFDTTGGTQHITQSRQTYSAEAPPDKTAEDFKGAIGVSGEGEKIEVEGVDITMPTYSFSETHIIADESVTGAYKNTLFELTGRVNNATFKGFAIGEVLFLGARGSKRGDGDWEIAFNFAVSKNEYVNVGDIEMVYKPGWSYLWVRYATRKGAKRYVKQPVQANVEQVYDDGVFSGLGI